MKQTLFFPYALIILTLLQSCTGSDEGTTENLDTSTHIETSIPTDAAAADPALTIVSWGGRYTASQNESYHKPFTALTNIPIINIDKGLAAPAGVRAQVNAQHVTWDLVDVIESDAKQLCRDGIAEPIAYDFLLARGVNGLLAGDDFIHGLSQCFIPTSAYATLLAYNTRMFSKKSPQSIADLFDLHQFPGKRALEKKPDNNLEWALIADGVAIDMLYQTLSTTAGINRAFAKLDTIKKHVIWWTQPQQSIRLLVRKEVALASTYNHNLFIAAAKHRQPLNLLWDGQSIEFNGWVIPKGKASKHLIDYLFFATDSQRLANQSQWLAYGSTRKSSAPLVSTHAILGVDMAPYIPTMPEHMESAFFKDIQFWRDNGNILTERFNAWLATE